MKILEDPPVEVKSELPGFVEVIVYPASLHGLIQIGIMVVGLFLVDLASRLAVGVHLAGLLVLAFRVLLLGYG